ncbi:MAG TPA: PKD domain-containing protein, partial [Bacteroidales bacterium]|nr:PKD domain-containing protein [Bacteroidales bacterium]
MKAISTILTCYFALMAFSHTSAQVVADFTMSASSGCSPLTVDFTDKSTGTGALTYTWVLGNGNTSSLQNPQAVYSNPGTYNVKLTVVSGSYTNSITKTITVFKNPVADFTASKTKGCTPLDVTFTDASTKGDANIVKWNWDFRNGEISTEQSPRLSFSAGSYTAFLEVTDGNNCKSNKEKVNYVDVANPPIVSFSANPSTSCKIPSTVQFDNSSTGAGNLTYTWVFAPGATSTDAKPKYTYTAFGTYNVSLTVNSDYGCSSTLNVPSVVIGEVNAAGTLKQGTKTIANNSIICAGDIDYTNSSTGATDFMWNFGDESTSTSSSGKHTYTTPGQYKILLIASPLTPCADTVVWNVTVEKAIANFSMTPEKSCNRSTPVSFVNQSSTNVIKYEWAFHDKTTSPDKDVSKTYTEKKDRDEYVIHEPSSYPVKLIVTSTNGCKDSIEKVLTVQLPTALFSPSTVQGCAPLKVLFDDYSSSDDPIKDRIWKFGEGADETTVNTSTAHLYNTPGTYEVKLIAVTATGCRDTSNIIKINVGSKVTPDFSVTPSFCSSEKIDFTYLSPAGATKWHYFVGGKSVPSCPDVSNPSVYMKTPYGPLDVKLEVENNGCFSEATRSTENKGPVGSFSYVVDCTSPLKVSFTGIATGASSYLWDFGDGNTSTSLSATHTYLTEGDYTVTFVAQGATCDETTVQIVKVRKRDAVFTLPAEICAGTGGNFNSSLSHTMVKSCGEKYLWNFGDNSQQIRTRKDEVSHSFENGGTYTVKLYAFYDDGCIDSADHTIRVYKPQTKFKVDKKKGCTPITVTFTDESVADVHPLNSWTWDFQEGAQPLTYTTQKPSVTNMFETPGQYLVSLTVGDNFGCIGSFIDTISTATPTAGFGSSSNGICSGTEIDFLPDFPDADSTLWDFGNGHKVRSRDPFVRYLY